MRQRGAPPHCSFTGGEGNPRQDGRAPPHHATPSSLVGLLHRAYNWSLWLILALLLVTQVLAAVWQQQRVAVSVVYGRDPNDGLSVVSGSLNDEPFADRLLVCSLSGRLYKPMQLSAALSAANGSSVSAASLSIDGYRVIRRAGLVLSTLDHYANTCDQIATTLDGIVDACSALGYNVTGVDHLRIVTSDDELLHDLPATLPVLVLPYWDNALFSRYAIPSRDGRACVFRLAGKYADATLEFMRLEAVERRVREAKTAQWLHVPHGQWRHGWYEDATSQKRWYSDLFSTTSRLGIARRQFDTTSSRETDCTNATNCATPGVKTLWGADLYSLDWSSELSSVTVLDEQRNGLFHYESTETRQVFSVYRLEVVIANVSVALLLFRWLAAMVASHRSGRTIGVGALACSRSFHVLPMVLLPRMKGILAAFWTAGCFFEGDQRCLSEAWFVMYPALAEFCWLLFSLLNLLAKVLRRRVSDRLFGPTLLLLLLLQRLRTPLVTSGWLELSGRVTSLVSSSEYEALQLPDLFATGVAFRLNGRFMSIFAFKMALLVMNLAPLAAFADNTSPHSRVRAGVACCEAEKALALRLACNGGLGRSTVYEHKHQHQSLVGALPPVAHKLEAIVPVRTEQHPSPQQQQHEQQQSVAKFVLPYELARAGYVVLGEDALVSIQDWFWFLASAPFRAVGVPMHHLRMVTFALTEEIDPRGVWRISERPTMCRVTDERFHRVGAWEISLRPLR